MRRPQLKNEFLPIAEHSVQYMNDTLWDKQYGGFYWGLDDKGAISITLTASTSAPHA